MLGNAVAPPTLLFMQSLVAGVARFWRRGARPGPPVLLLTREPAPLATKARKRDDRPPRSTAGGFDRARDPINLVFFILLSFCGGGLNNYLVAALGALYGTPAAVANSALTALLIMSAAGVLVGGILTGMTSRHGLVASGGLVVTAIVCVLIGLIDFNALALVVLMSAAGFFSGLTMPSRDMIVRAVTPPGAYGRCWLPRAVLPSPASDADHLRPATDHGYVRDLLPASAVRCSRSPLSRSAPTRKRAD